MLLIIVRNRTILIETKKILLIYDKRAFAWDKNYKNVQKQYTFQQKVPGGPKSQQTLTAWPFSLPLSV